MKAVTKKSDLRKWIEKDLFKMFPAVIRDRISELSIPTLGEICGWDDEWAREYIEADGDKQLPLMKQRRNQVAYYDNELNGVGLEMLQKRSFLRLISLLCTTVAMRAAMELLALVGFVRNSGCLDKITGSCALFYIYGGIQ